MESNVTDDQPERGVATWKVELFVSLALLLFGAVIAFKSWQLGAGWLEDGPGAGYFPFYIGVLVCVASLVVSARTLMAGGRDDSVFVSHAQLKLVFTVLLPSLAFVLAAQFLGLYVASFLFIAGFMVWVGHYGWARSAGIAFAVMVLAFLMFEVWFKVPLFKGALNPLRFLGY
jgi:Tripartite tricarboxylate transporter TctB family